MNGRNYPNFEHKKLHFGAMLGTTSTSFRYKISESVNPDDSINNISINSQPGMAIHVPVISWNPHHVFQIRLVPSISFHETEFAYTYIEKQKKKQKITRTEPVSLNFPLLIKLNTKRITNFSAYAITGASYNLNLTSQHDVDQTLGDPIVKLKQHDFMYHIGGGFDFYLPYFKFGVELKLSNGLRNLLIQDETFFSSPLTALYSRCWWFSFTFEG